MLCAPNPGKKKKICAFPSQTDRPHDGEIFRIQQSQKKLAEKT